VFATFGVREKKSINFTLTEFHEKINKNFTDISTL